MSNTNLYAVLVLSAVGAVSAIILYFAAQKFKVIAEPQIYEVEDILPKTNCGGCGFAGCSAFAEKIVKDGTLDGLNCPVGGNAVMTRVAQIMGLQANEIQQMIAVLRCNGSRKNAPSKIKYDGPENCAFAHHLFSGENGCPQSCLGLGDCVVSCDFDALYLDEKTGLPVVVANKCVACKACVKACPRKIFEMRSKGKDDRRIYVSCVNTEKSTRAKENCGVACIGCRKCVKACVYDAIELKNNLAYIDFEKCTLCRKCVAECPTNAILEVNFPTRQGKPTEVEVASGQPSPAELPAS